MLRNGRYHSFCLCGWGGEKVVPDFSIPKERAESKHKSWLSETERKKLGKFVQQENIEEKQAKPHPLQILC